MATHRSNSSYAFLCFIVIMSWYSKAELPSLKHSPKADGSLSFLVIGDWGRRGTYNQSLVASQMGVIGEKLDIDFVISTGDNFCNNGLTGVHDPAFQDSFTNIYKAPSLHKNWYNVLGNHDYRGNAKAQISPILRHVDKRWICFRSYIVNSENVVFFFVDTTPFVDKYLVDTEGHVNDWRGVLPRKRYLSNLLKDLDLALRQSAATWKIVIGHHAIKSAGHHGDTQELFNSIFDEWWPVGPSHENVKFYYDGQGLMSVQISQTLLQIAFYDVFANLLHHWNTSKLYYSPL